MNETVHIGTRKGLFQFTRTAPGQWQRNETAFLGDPVTMVLTDPRTGDRYAGLNHGHFGVKLHAARAGTSEWKEIGTPAFPKVEDGDGPTVELIWELVTGGEDEPGTLWAGTIPGGLFKSTDNGESWRLIDALWQKPEREKWFGGGYDKPGIHSICVHPHDSNTIRLAISCGGVWESTNGGETWQQTGQGLRAAFMPPELA